MANVIVKRAIEIKYYTNSPTAKTKNIYIPFFQAIKMHDEPTSLAIKTSKKKTATTTTKNNK